MFYSICVLFVILSAAFADYDMRPVVHLPPAENEKIQKAAQECLDETGAQGDVAKGFFNLQIEPDETSKNFLCCVTRKAYYSNLDGHLNNNLLRLFENSEYWDEVKAVFEGCNRIKNKKKRTDTLYEIVQCFIKNSPVLLTE